MSVVDRRIVYACSQKVGSHEAVDLSFLRLVKECLSTTIVLLWLSDNKLKPLPAYSPFRYIRAPPQYGTLMHVSLFRWGCFLAERLVGSALIFTKSITSSL